MLRLSEKEIKTSRMSRKFNQKVVVLAETETELNILWKYYQILIQIIINEAGWKSRSIEFSL